MHCDICQINVHTSHRVSKTETLKVYIVVPAELESDIVIFSSIRQVELVVKFE